jgi:hypothetical protein
MNPVSQPFGPCPCEPGVVSDGDITITMPRSCVAIGTKLTKFGHLVGCTCRSCLGRRNQRSGKRAQARGHRALGGIGFTPSNEESHGAYDLRVQVEHKTGEQVPASFRKFVTLDWTRRALNQAERAVRVGDGAHPSVMIDGRWLIVDCRSIGPTPTDRSVR